MVVYQATEVHYATIHLSQRGSPNPILQMPLWIEQTADQRIIDISTVYHTLYHAIWISLSSSSETAEAVSGQHASVLGCIELATPPVRGG